MPESIHRAIVAMLGRFCVALCFSPDSTARPQVSQGIGASFGIHIIVYLEPTSIE
jgi:hypothetical protein